MLINKSVFLALLTFIVFFGLISSKFDLSAEIVMSNCLPRFVPMSPHSCQACHCTLTVCS